MKTSPRQLFLSAAVACFFTLTLAALAQDTKQPVPAAAPAPAEKTPAAVAPAVPAAQPAPAAVTATAATPPAAPTPETPATAPTPETPPTPATAATPETPETPATAAEPASADEPKTEAPALRRLDEPVSPAAVPAGTKKALHKMLKAQAHHSHGNEIVSIGHDSVLAKDHKADAVVAVFGSSTSDGEVSDSVVSVLGNTRVTGPVGNAALAVFGNTYVNSKVGDTVLAVFGNVELGPDAVIGGDVVAIGGGVTRDPKAVVHGEVHNISFGGVLSDMSWLRAWFTQCVLYGRLLAFGPNLMWAWWVALSFLAFYVVLALLFGKGVDKCVATVEERPGYSILAALLTVLLIPVAVVLLAITGVGIAVIPFLAAGLFFAGLFGKVVMLAWLGRRLTGFFAGTIHPALAVLVGGVVMLFLYTVPILGIVLYKLMGWVGLGVVVYTLLLGMKREKPAVPPVVPPAPGTTPAVGTAGAALLAPGAPPVVSAVTLPRAGFWIRMAALLLDLVLVWVVTHLLFHLPFVQIVLLVLPGYGAVMWKLKGSTIGGIVCGLKVVRLDDRPIDWGTAIVRALGSLLSFVVLGLGFIWVVFDDEKQSWHDKIAGTTVVRAPKGVSLV